MQRMQKIILASTSPARREILLNTGFKFSVEKSGYEEDMGLKLPPRRLAVFLAREKAEAVARRNKRGIVIAADTLVVHGRAVFGKPGSAARARKILSQLSGKTHTIITGIAVLDASTGKVRTRSVATRVTLRKLSKHDISRYASTKESQNAAGGYAIQGKFRGMLIERISGDYSNIAGLPLTTLQQMLREFGVR